MTSEEKRMQQRWRKGWWEKYGKITSQEQGGRKTGKVRKGRWGKEEKMMLSKERMMMKKDGKRTEGWEEKRRKGRKNENVSQTEGLKIAATYSFFTSVCSTTRLVFFSSSFSASTASLSAILPSLSSSLWAPSSLWLSVRRLQCPSAVPVFITPAGFFKSASNSSCERRWRGFFFSLRPPTTTLPLPRNH